MDRHMAPSTSPVALPGGHSTIITAQTLAISVGLFLIYWILRGIYSIYIYPFHVSPLRHLPTPMENHHWFLGQMVTLFSTPWIPYLYREWSRSCPDSPFLRILKAGNSETLVPNTIAAYREILQTSNDYFVKPQESRNGAVLVIGDGLTWAHGVTHRQHKAALNKLFSPQKMRQCVPRIEAKVKQLSKVLAAKQTVAGDEVQIEETIWRAALDVAGIKSMGTDLDHLGSDTSPLYGIFSATMRPNIRGHIVRWLATHMPLREYLPLEAFSGFVRKCSAARSFIGQHVQQRRMAWQRGEKRDASDDGDLLQGMIEHEGLWGDSEIIEYILNFMVLGHDTTACTLVWAIDVLARRPDIQQRLRCEMASLKEHSWAEIDRLHYLENFIRESLRLYCPVGWIPREATCDINVAGVLVPKGTNINLVPAMVNLKPEIWGADAGVFDPDRWDRLEGEAGSAYAFATFHNGPRVCIGRALTMMEMKLVVAELVSRFRLEATHEGELALDTPSFTLKPKELLRVRLHDA